MCREMMDVILSEFEWVLYHARTPAFLDESTIGEYHVPMLATRMSCKRMESVTDDDKCTVTQPEDQEDLMDSYCLSSIRRDSVDISRHDILTSK